MNCQARKCSEETMWQMVTREGQQLQGRLQNMDWKEASVAAKAGRQEWAGFVDRHITQGPDKQRRWPQGVK